QQVNACDVNSMRNLAARYAKGDNEEKKRYDYIVMLDDDHHYPPGFIIRFIKIMNKHNLEILTGLTSSKRPPYMSTQYHKLEFPINRLENTVVCKKPMDKITQVEASGPVGMLIKTSVFDKLKYPYYHV